MPEPTQVDETDVVERQSAGLEEVPAWWLAVYHWIQDRGLVFWIAALLIMAGVWGFSEIAEVVQEGEGSQRWDEAIFLAISNPDAPGFVKEIGRDLTALGGFAVVTLFILATVGLLLIRRQFAAMTLVLVATLGGLGLSTILKESFDRPRPDLVEHVSYTMTSSFPSGHSMLAATVYLTLGLLIVRMTNSLKMKVFVLSYAIFVTVLVGLSRIFVGVHWPTDVLAGWAGGATWATLCYLVARELQRRDLVEDPHQTTKDLDPTMKATKAPARAA